MVIEERAFIAASPAQVWSAIGDPERMPELSPELQRVEWLSPRELRVGGTYRGHNRVGPVRWTTTNVIEQLDPGSVFAWRTLDGPRNSFVSRWTYRLRPQSDGCEVTERWETASWLAVAITRGLLWGRGRMLRHGMRTTLQSLKKVAEEPAATS